MSRVISRLGIERTGKNGSGWCDTGVDTHWRDHSRASDINERYLGAARLGAQVTKPHLQIFFHVGIVGATAQGPAAC